MRQRLTSSYYSQQTLGNLVELRLIPACRCHVLVSLYSEMGIDLSLPMDSLYFSFFESDPQQQQHFLIEGSLNSKLPTIWRVEKQMRQAVKSKVKRCTSAKVRRKKTHPRQMLEKSRHAVFFQ